MFLPLLLLLLLLLHAGLVMSGSNLQVHNHIGRRAVCNASDNELWVPSAVHPLNLGWTARANVQSLSCHWLALPALAAGPLPCCCSCSWRLSDMPRCSSAVNAAVKVKLAFFNVFALFALFAFWSLAAAAAAAASASPCLRTAWRGDNQTLA